MACQTLPVLKYTNIQISVDKPAVGTLRCLKTRYIGVIILDSKRQHDFTEHAPTEVVQKSWNSNFITIEVYLSNLAQIATLSLCVIIKILFFVFIMLTLGLLMYHSAIIVSLISICMFVYCVLNLFCKFVRKSYSQILCFSVIKQNCFILICKENVI